MSSPFWVRKDVGLKWHRVRRMMTFTPYVVTYCGMKGADDGEWYRDTEDRVPVGLTCRRCLPA